MTDPSFTINRRITLQMLATAGAAVAAPLSLEASAKTPLAAKGIGSKLDLELGATGTRFNLSLIHI